MTVLAIIAETASIPGNDGARGSLGSGNVDPLEPDLRQGSGIGIGVTAKAVGRKLESVARAGAGVL